MKRSFPERELRDSAKRRPQRALPGVIPLAKPIVMGMTGRARIVGVMEDATPEVLEHLADMQEAA